ncbi:chorismate pyruvate-lyase family protein [Bacillus paranthracis]|uniref:chorismate pyruvate-lyase family protein n=1 Tax=Bacillus paranthracis TaxID=2026186 RepID=UPI003D64C456
MYKNIFHKNFILEAQNYLSYGSNYDIPKKWKLILINDGSLTQSLSSLTGKPINLKIVKEYNNKLINKIYRTREVWLEDQKFNKLAFAQSVWPSYYNTELPDNKPVGQSFIENQLDIHKEIHEVYYGYSQYIESKFNCQGPIWGRKYTIYHKATRLTTLDEIFSPQIAHFFNIKT